MALRIAFDLDGVFADMEAALMREFRALCADVRRRRFRARNAGDVPPADANGASDTLSLPTMTDRQYRRLWKRVAMIENFWETLAEIEPGTIARLASLASERSWEIIFLTKRPRTAGATSQLQSQRWLQANGFSHPCVYVVQGSRGRIAAALDLDIVVDDRSENCLDVIVDSRAKTLLVWREDDAGIPADASRLGIRVVRSVHECLDVLIAMDDKSTSSDMTLGDRIKKFLGLKAPLLV